MWKLKDVLQKTLLILAWSWLWAVYIDFDKIKVVHPLLNYEAILAAQYFVTELFPNHFDSNIRMNACCEFNMFVLLYIWQIYKYCRSYDIEHEKYFVHFGDSSIFWKFLWRSSSQKSNNCMHVENVFCLFNFISLGQSYWSHQGNFSYNRSYVNKLHCPKQVMFRVSLQQFS